MTDRGIDLPKPSFIERTKLKVLPLFSLPTGENLLADIYHRISALGEVLGYPSPKRHKDFFVRQLKEVQQGSQSDRFNTLLLGAMSPSSILDVMEIIQASAANNPSLTVIDISRAPLAAAKTELKKIASKMGIRLHLVQADLRTLCFRPEYFNVVLADQVYNFLPEKDYTPATKHIMDFVAPGGKFVNVISVIRQGVPYFGNWHNKFVNEQASIYPANTTVEGLARDITPQSLSAAPFLKQTAVIIEKPIAQDFALELR